MARILVVDDNVDGAESLAIFLRMHEHETHIVNDGPAAVTAAESYGPDAILLDIGMPLLNGLDVCRQIRGQSWSQGMVLIALTGWGQESDRQHSQAAGFDHHLVKPVDPQALMKLLAGLSDAARK